TQCLRTRMFRVARRHTMVPPALAARRGDQVGLDTLGCVPGKHATASEGLVIRVGKDPHESKWIRLAGGFRRHLINPFTSTCMSLLELPATAPDRWWRKLDAVSGGITYVDRASRFRPRH